MALLNKALNGFRFTWQDHSFQSRSVNGVLRWSQYHSIKQMAPERAKVSPQHGK
jgi:hypothetical protein